MKENNDDVDLVIDILDSENDVETTIDEIENQELKTKLKSFIGFHKTLIGLLNKCNNTIDDELLEDFEKIEEISNYISDNDLI